MCFHQRPVIFSCPGPNASLRSGGWQGSGAAPYSGGFSGGDLLASFSADPQQTYDYLDWMDGSSNYAGPEAPPPHLATLHLPRRQ